jgi:hypothetical protein
MNLLLHIARIGSHVGHLEDNQPLGVEEDTQEVSLETLSDPASLRSLHGVPVRWNHLDANIGQVTGQPYIEGGILCAEVTVDDPQAIELLGVYRESGDSLEVSPSFTCKTELDKFNRVQQVDRRYTEVSILTPAMAGRGGLDMRAVYNASIVSNTLTSDDMDELKEMMAALMAKFDMISHTADPEDDTAQYEEGVKEGMARAEANYALQSLTKHNGITAVGDTLEAKITSALTQLDIPVGDQSASYLRAAVVVASVASTKVPVGKQPETKFDSKPPAQKQGRAVIALNKKKVTA